MRLIGAKKFLKTANCGTLFVEFWRNKEICHKIINDFNNGIDVIKKYEGTFRIFGNNYHSLSFIVDEEDTDSTTAKIDGITYYCLFDSDVNIIGDAGPTETLYLIFDNEEEWPNEFKIDSYEYDYEPLTKEDIKKIQKWFKEVNPSDDISSANERALQMIYANDYLYDDEIVNYGFTKPGDLLKQILNK